MALANYVPTCAKNTPGNERQIFIAPTGTIGLVMDCDTTGIESDFSLVKFKKLVGGGYFKLINQSVEPALKKLGYSQNEIQNIIRYAAGSTDWLISLKYPPPTSFLNFTSEKSGSIPVVSQSITRPIVPVGAMQVA